MTARFNTIYNGQRAFEDGLEAQVKGHRDNYNELLPMFISIDKKTAAMGKSNYETAITKAEKAIKQHSIKKKPKRPRGRKMTPKEQAYYNQREFNPYLRKAWMMFADAQFQMGNFIEAASTYNYIIRLYENSPDVSSVARAKLARCYLMLEWPYDAEDVLNKMQRDSITSRGQKELDATKAAFLIFNQRYEEAIPLVKTATKNAGDRQLKARLWFLIGQLYRQVGNNKEAYKALSKCTRLNPSHDLGFNARILQTEVMAKGQGKAMLKRLDRMAKDPANKDYLDQIYYAKGNICIASMDTIHAIYAWKKGIEESTQNGFAKAVLCERLGELYWQQQNYIDARECYDLLVGLTDKESKQYPEINRRSKVLGEVEPHLSAVKLQDSLQALAKLPEKEYLAVIDRVIEELKKKEKEAEEKEWEKSQSVNRQTAGGAGGSTARGSGASTTARAGAGRGRQTTTFYFYNAQSVMQGKQEFQRKWGKRSNEDNWRRANKTVLAGDEYSEYDYAAEDSLAAVADSVAAGGHESGAGEEVLSEEEQALKDSLANDPHNREYYLRQIPFTEEQMAASDQLISDGLYNGGIILMEKVENFPLARRTLLRAVNKFPEHEHLDDIYYHLFLLSLREGKEEQISLYRQNLLALFPDSKYARIVSHPRFLQLASNGRHLEDSLYAETYEAYKAADYALVNSNFEISTSDFPEGVYRGKFLFIHAMTQLYTGHHDAFLEELKEMVKSYSKDELAEMAGLIVKGVQEGRLLAPDKWDNGDIWSRHSLASNSDSTAVSDSLVADPLQPFVFLLAYPTGALDENQLLFEIAQYNFTSFIARNFDMELVPGAEISQLRVKGFQSYDEVHAYAQQLYSAPGMRTRLEGIRGILISEANLKLLGTKYSYEEYADFYEEMLSPIELPEDINIDEPTDIGTTDPDDLPADADTLDPEGDGEEEEDEEEEDEDDWLYE
ncbi:MAG: DUF2225 domain-containing protein [Bacteroidaceae bacterium]|nr:DUF2225 domain-containing protein [Bacteroidaceae bacterium]